MKKLLLVFVVISLFLIGCSKDTLQDRLDKITFDLENTEINYVMNSTQGNINKEVKYYAKINLDNKVVETKKTIDNKEEVNKVYFENNEYKLYQKIESTEVTIVITKTEADNFYSEVVETTKNYYLNLKPIMTNVEDEVLEKNKIEYTENVNNIHNEYLIETTKNKLTKFSQTYTKNNKVYNINLTVNYL